MDIAVSIEKPSEHPLAEAIVSYGNEHDMPGRQLDEFTAVSGRGIRARLDNAKYLAGNAAFLIENGISTSTAEAQLGELADQGKTPLLFAKDDQIIGMIAVADVEKESSRKAIELFRNMNIDVIMLTGDNERTAKAIQKRMGIRQVIAQVLPEEKEKKIAQIQGSGHTVAMIGDGINDAPALARADVGIAIGAGTDVAIESADIVLMKSDLLDAVTAVQLSKAVIRNIKQNLFWAFFYNSIGIPLAAGILYPAFGLKLNPMFGAAAMSLSSVCVVTNALRLKLFKPNKIISENPSDSEAIKEEEEMFGRKKYDAVMEIEGMMCHNCERHVFEALSAIDGVEAKVDHTKNEACLTLASDVSDETLTKAVEDSGYKVLKIKR